jgi:hypothetical protein
MLSFEPNVVVIDDKIDEIDGIIKWYNRQGIGCKYFNSDLVDGDEMPTFSYSDVSLVFLDLFFSSDSVDHELCANWIQSIIPEKAFYVLIIWTKDPDEVDLVLEELKKLNRLPFAVLKKNKSIYPSHAKYKYDFNKLFQEIDKELKTIPSLAEIGIWKKTTKRATNVVIGGISKRTDPELFNSKLQKIIVGHGGTSIIKSNDDGYKRKILFDALDQVLISNSKDTIPNDEIQNINKDQLYNIPEKINSEIDRELNSWFHFKMEREIAPELIISGLLCEILDGIWKKYYSIYNDKIIIELLSKQKGEAIVIKSIAVLISRPCDIAQSKYGNNLKLLSGIQIVNPTRKKNQKREFQFGCSKPDCVKIYDHIYLSAEENDVTLLFDFRYVFSVPEKVFMNEFKNIKVFNKEILSELIVEYSSYSSRLGITQII